MYEGGDLEDDGRMAKRGRASESRWRCRRPFVRCLRGLTGLVGTAVRSLEAASRCQPEADLRFAHELLPIFSRVIAEPEPDWPEFGHSQSERRSAAAFLTKLLALNWVNTNSGIQCSFVLPIVK